MLFTALSETSMDRPCIRYSLDCEHTHEYSTGEPQEMNSEHTLRAACTISKRYTKKGASPYWYAYHPQWDEFLGEGENSFLVLGCMDCRAAFAIPLKVFRSVLEHLNTTNNEYWHLHLAEDPTGALSLMLPKKKSLLPISTYSISLPDQDAT